MLRRFLRRDKTTIDLKVSTEAPYQPDPNPIPDSIEMAIPLRHVAALFVANGWSISIDGRTVVEPTPERIGEVIASLLNDLVHDPGMFYSTLGRIMAVRDGSYPDDIDLYLYIGRAHTALEDATSV